MRTCSYGDKYFWCDKPATKEVVIHEWMDDHTEDFDTQVCEEHYEVLKENGGYAPAHPRSKLKAGDEALFEPEFPFFEATLEETQRRVWVCSVRYIIVGVQAKDNFEAELLIGQPVEWACENVVRLGRRPLR